MLRSKTPSRRENRAVCAKYSSYRDTLREDFNNRCGYCDDYDFYRIRSFTIDHFFPQHPQTDTILNPIPANNYYNLVYCCSYCNSAKSNKWHTTDSAIHHANDKGYIDPCTDEYTNTFTRDSEGRIKPIDPNNALAKFIIDDLKLWLPIHSLMWKVNKLHTLELKVRDKINKMASDDPKTSELKKQHYDIMYVITDIFSKIFKHNE